ncbi:signal peptidase II [Arcicella aurantiaca]|uniref:Lipoprotein signal peptidase n=1 Tax=Arcicella aurantiaca TaxID=591202 RepID=A0A316EFY9_9BACT|nr:lipoprotein signal peptidase [Arcicella aurantiaca]PWK28613.1 signal peptidase II [Arcicella aurantiaca]
MFRSPYKYFLLTLLLIVIDQLIKLAVHRYMMYEGNEIEVFGHWFKLHYVLNRGMAFGMELSFIPGGYAKIVLSLFRLAAMFGIGYYLVRLASRKAPEGLLWSIAAILGGAIGNVIDSTFYGKLLENNPPGSPTPWFHGQVIDMFFFDPYQGWIPDWVPLWGGTWYSTPIFNFADAAIFCGVVTILIFQNKFFEQPKEAEIEESFEETADKIENINNEEISDKVENIVIEENTKEENSDSTKE